MLFRKLVVTLLSCLAVSLGTLDSLRATPVPDRKGGNAGVHEVTTIAGGIVIDPADNAAYVMNTDGGIDAIDLRTGKLLWATEQKKGDSYWPIGVIGNNLVVRMRDPQRQVHIAVLAIDQKGKQLLLSNPLDFGALEAYPWFDNTGSSSGGAVKPPRFNQFVTREVLDKDKLIIDWSGAAGIGFTPRTPDREGYGTLEIDLKKAAVKVVQKETGKPQKPLAVTPAVVKAELGGRNYTVEETQKPGKSTSHFFKITAHDRKLKATDRKGKLLWEHPLKGWSYILDQRPIPRAR